MSSRMKSTLSVEPFAHYLQTRFDVGTIPTGHLKGWTRGNAPTAPTASAGLGSLENPTAIWHLATKIHKRLPERFPHHNSIYRALMRYIAKESQHIYLEVADDLCIGLGVHPSYIWGDEYRRVSDYVASRYEKASA